MLIEIPLNDEIRICSPDPLNYTVEKKRVVKSGPNAGKVSWDVLGYHGSLDAAARSVLKSHANFFLKDPEAIKDLKSLVNAIDEGADLIARACAEAGPRIRARNEGAAE